MVDKMYWSIIRCNSLQRAFAILESGGMYSITLETAYSSVTDFLRIFDAEKKAK